jgi:hypothetical protein
MQNDHWKHIEDITTDPCTIPTIGRLAAYLKGAEAFLRHWNPKPIIIDHFSNIILLSFAIKQPNG